LQKFELDKLSRDPVLNIDFKKEYFENPVTQIAQILRGSKCDVYIVSCLEVPNKEM